MKEELSDKQLNLAMCEVRGIEVIKCPFVPNEIKPNKNTVFTIEAAGHFRKCYPYATGVRLLLSHTTGIESLNNMHAAALELRDKDRLKYAIYHKELERVVAIDNMKEEFGIMTADATSRQRAIAFLRTVRPELFPGTSA